MDYSKQYEVWFITGSQHSTEMKPCSRPGEHCQMVDALNHLSRSQAIVFKPVLPIGKDYSFCLKLMWKPTLTTWMHTFTSCVD